MTISSMSSNSLPASSGNALAADARSLDELKLAAGQSASAVIKASDVMIAID